MRGSFFGTDDHTTTGTVDAQSDKLVFADLSSEAAPDPKVYLAKGGNHREGGLLVGPLPQPEGSFTMSLPAGAETSEFDSVVIHCDQFDVGIGQANLS
jgi:hypothetical protein